MSWKSHDNFPCLVTSEALQQYKKLPKKGKPISKEEWTPMAAILQHNSDNTLKVITIGTGSKCIGETKMNKDGWVLNDSHGEVIARRQFVRYLLNQLHLALTNNGPSIFTHTKPLLGGSSEADTDEDEADKMASMFSIKSGISFHFFTTQVPCGDAAIFPQSGTPGAGGGPGNSGGDVPQNCAGEYSTASAAKRLKLESDELQPAPTISKEIPATHLPNNHFICSRTAVVVSVASLWTGSEGKCTSIPPPDTHRTGAKCIASGPQDPKSPGPAYHTPGVLRTKPGRGDPTRSMACSDKILRWNVLGCQGALLAHFVSAPVVLETFTVASCVFDREALTRAICGRLRQSPGVSLRVHEPVIHHCQCQLGDVEDCGLASWSNQKVAPAAISYCLQPHSHEVIVQGLRQGVNLKLNPDRRSSVSICKHRIFEEFMTLLEGVTEENLPASLRNWRKTLKSYHSFKAASTSHNEAKATFLLACPMWLTNNPGLEDFNP